MAAGNDSWVRHESAGRVCTPQYPRTGTPSSSVQPSAPPFQTYTPCLVPQRSMPRPSVSATESPTTNTRCTTVAAAGIAVGAAEVGGVAAMRGNSDRTDAAERVGANVTAGSGATAPTTIAHSTTAATAVGAT